MTMIVFLKVAVVQFRHIRVWAYQFGVTVEVETKVNLDLFSSSYPLQTQQQKSNL